ncbi:inorganic triphosphatase [Sphingomonas sp. DBB INV C78]|uniref:CYTH and CHAD domain-containing protein n=1 Tax=Sphingomonas sp. DBB INV C78 TaxID=3349434 RepID=UPI0036D2B860
MIYNDELELKLDAAPDAAAAIEASPLLAELPSQQKNLHSIYFDTRDHALRSVGLSLRVRHDGERYIQTLKATDAPAVGLFARKEWEREIPDNAIVIDDVLPLGAWLDGFDAAAVGPLFEVVVSRRIYDVEQGGARFELAIDHGSVSAEGSTRSFCELELELKDGPPAALFEFARRLDAIAPLRCGVLSKSERGYRLVDQEDCKASKAGQLNLAAGTTAGEGFAAIVKACIKQFRLNEALFLANRNARALHQARVALRRLRSALSTFRPMLKGVERRKELADGLRRLGNALSQARGLDVLLDGLPEEDRASLERTRRAAYDAAVAAFDSARTRGLMIDLAEWIATGAAMSSPRAAAPLSPLAVDALDRFRRQIKRAGKLDELDDEARHHVRIAAKKLRYASEYFCGLFAGRKAGKRYDRFIAALEILQDRLGRLNDMVTAPDLLRQIGMDEFEKLVRIDPVRCADLIAEGEDARKKLLDRNRFWR